MSSRLKYIQLSELPVPYASSSEVEYILEAGKMYHQILTILADVIQARNNTSHSEIHKITNYIGIGKNCHSSGRNLLLHLFIKSDKTDYNY